MNEILGVDIGNVIIDRSNDSDQKFFSEQYLEVPPIAGVFEALRKLVELRFGERVFLVSRVSREELAEINKGWLLHHDFYGKTGVKQDRVIFCAGRHEKSDICKKLGITHFVDDRLEVLSHMVGKIENLYLFRPRLEEASRFSDFWQYVFTVRSWYEVMEDMLHPHVLSRISGS